jgi:hypothetical protein
VAVFWPAASDLDRSGPQSAMAGGSRCHNSTQRHQRVNLVTVLNPRRGHKEVPPFNYPHI